MSKENQANEETRTRSGLLWEVERILNEVEHLPQILVMENVANIKGKKNIDDFNRWKNALEWMGYSNYDEILNAVDFGIPQSRKRCFMISILGDHYYEFPKPIPLETTMKDYLEPEVDEKYYIKTEKARDLIDKLIIGGKILTSERTNERTNERTGVDLSYSQAKTTDITSCIKARYDGGINLPKNERTGICEVRSIP